MNQEERSQAIQVARRVVLEQEVARKSDGYDSQARDYAEQLTQTELNNTQVRGLEVLACTTDKVSDVTDWLKIQVGRDRERNRWACKGIGRKLLDALEGLRKDAQQIVAKVRDFYHPEDPDLERQIHLQLIREYLKHLTAHFEYVKAQRREN